MGIEKDKDPNQLFMLRAGKGEKPLRVLLSQRPGDESGLSSSAQVRVSRKKTPIVPRRKPDNAISMKRKAGGVIKFYDLGQRWNGSAWVDLPYRGDLDILSSGFTDYAGFNSDFTLTQWDDFRNEIFTVDPEDWATSYRLIEYAEAKKYGIAFSNNSGDYTVVDEANTDWTEQGLKLNNADAAWRVIPSAGNNVFIRVDPSLGVKITTGPNYSDPSASFSTLKDGDKIFLVPRPVIPIGVGEDVGTNAEFIMNKYQIRSREFWLDRLYGTLPAMAQGSPIEDDTLFADYIARVKADSWVKYFSGDIAALVEGSPAPFPTYPGSAIADSSNGDFIFFSAWGTTSQVEGTLNSVIQRGSVFYYIWWDGTGLDDGVTYTTITEEP